MKRQATYLKLILVGTLLVHVGCSSNQPRRDQNYLMSGGADSADHSIAGNAFRTSGNPGTGAIPTGGVPGGNLGTSVLSSIFGAPDADRDSVADSIDQCEGTPANTQVDAKGCPVTNGAGAGEGSSGAAGKTDETVNSFTVNLSSEPRWKKACEEAGHEISRRDLDTDGDGISDKCEDALKTSEEFIGLDSKVFNGALVVAKRFYKEKDGLLDNKKADASSGSILLTEDETKAWKASKALGGFGDGVDAKFDRQIAKKFLALATLGGSDMKGLSDLLAINQAEKVGFEAYFQAIADNQVRKRGKDNGLSVLNDKLQYALVRNDFYEMIPFALGKDNRSVAFLSGIAGNVNSLRQNEEFLYIAETHVVIPEELDGGMELRVGHLIADKTKAVAGSKTGMFIVMHDNNTDIVTTDLIKSDLTGDELERSMGTIPAPSNCVTSHLAIAYLADSQVAADAIKKAVFSESVFYHDTKADEWKPIPQEWMRLKPLDINTDQKCNIKSDEIIFKHASSYLSESSS